MRVAADMRATAKLRVVIISDALPERNGVGTYYHDLVEYLKGSIEHAELICPHYGAGLWKGWLSFPLPGDRTQKLTIPPVRQIHKRIREIAPHAIIVPTPGPYGLLGVYLAKRYGLKLLVGFHTHFEKLTDLYWNPFCGKFSQAFFRAFNRVFFRYSSVVLANSREMVAVAHRGGARKVQLMGTPVGRQFFREPTALLTDGLNRVLFAGRLAAEKNVSSVIAAAQEISNIQYVIVGDGPQRDLVVTQARKLSNLTYLGWLPRSKMPAALDRVDMLVLPSQVESFGTTALEAMARNRIVLASEKCGILDWPLLNQNIFRVGKTERITDAIRRVAQLDHQLHREKAESACEAARQFNDWTIRSWIEILKMDGVV